MKHFVSVAIAINLVFATCIWTFAIPKVMALDLHNVEDGIYASEVFHVPVRICNATLDISLLMDTFMRACLELRVGDNNIRFHLSDLSVSGHFEYSILELFAKVTSMDVTLRLFIDTDGIITGVPSVLITYYGIW